MKREKHSAFTLVELLVVISIIALLLAILMPALSKARDSGRRIVCLANLRTSSLATCAYASDNKDALMGGYVGVSGTTTDPTLSIYWNAWVEIPHDAQGNWTGGAPNAGMTFTDASMDDEIRGIKTGTLYKYINDVKPYHCASDPRNKSGDAWRSYTIAAGMNVDFPSYNSTYCVRNAKKMSDIRMPSQKYIFIENRDPRGWNMGFWDIYYTGTRSRVQWWNVVAGWHKKSSDWGFADGHVETQLWRDQKTIDICTQLDYSAQIGMRQRCSANNNDLLWILDRRMNSK